MHAHAKHMQYKILSNALMHTDNGKTNLNTQHLSSLHAETDTEM